VLTTFKPKPALPVMMDKTVVTTRKLIVCVFFLSLISCDLFAQQTTVKADTIADKLSLYGYKNQRPLLFIHFDKNVYTNNENVWFTGYFLNFVNRLFIKRYLFF
jgi:hypothetical protein